MFINGLYQLNRISTGCILLGGLFFYDVFWVSDSGIYHVILYVRPVREVLILLLDSLSDSSIVSQLGW